jgi:hypothetical protein
MMLCYDLTSVAVCIVSSNWLALCTTSRSHCTVYACLEGGTLILERGERSFCAATNSFVCVSNGTVTDCILELII